MSQGKCSGILESKDLKMFTTVNELKITCSRIPTYRTTNSNTRLTERQINTAREILRILNGVPGLNNRIDAAYDWVRRFPKLGIQRFGIQFSVKFSDTRSSWSKLVAYAAPMSSFSGCDLSEWVEVRLAEYIETLPPSEFKVELFPSTCDAELPSSSWWAE